VRVVRGDRGGTRTSFVSEQSSEREGQEGPLSVPDDDLPEDLRPSEENPLAQPAGDDVPEDVLKDTAGGSGGDSEDDAEPGGDDAPDASSGAASSEAESPPG
jgi:hypothetical protein